jgi:hypothetical protein
MDRKRSFIRNNRTLEQRVFTEAIFSSLNLVGVDLSGEDLFGMNEKIVVEHTRSYAGEPKVIANINDAIRTKMMVDMCEAACSAFFML